MKILIQIVIEEKEIQMVSGKKYIDVIQRGLRDSSEEEIDLERKKREIKKCK